MLSDERLPVPTPKSKGMFVNVNVTPGQLTTVQRLQRLVDTATTAHDKMVIDEYESLVVHLPAAGYGTTEFDMSDERRAALVDAGRTAVAAYFVVEGARAASAKTTSRRPAGRVEGIANRIATRILA
jgi:hypothetical protein